jgi:hypothetical protein
VNLKEELQRAATGVKRKLRNVRKESGDDDLRARLPLLSCPKQHSTPKTKHSDLVARHSVPIVNSFATLLPPAHTAHEHTHFCVLSHPRTPQNLFVEKPSRAPSSAPAPSSRTREREKSRPNAPRPVPPRACAHLRKERTSPPESALARKTPSTPTPSRREKKKRQSANLHLTRSKQRRGLRATRSVDR